MKRLTDLIGLALMISCSASAALTPKSHQLIAGIKFRSQVETQFGDNSNVTYQNGRSAARAAVRSDFMFIRPEIEVSGQPGQGIFRLMYTGQYRQFRQSPADDYSDHMYAFSGQWLPEKRHTFRWDIRRISGHESRGQGVTEGLSDIQLRRYGVNRPIQTSMLDAELAYDFGLPEGSPKLTTSLRGKTFSFSDTGNIDDNFRSYIRDQAWDERSYTVALSQWLSSDSQLRYSLMATQRAFQTNKIKDSEKYFLRLGFQTRYSGMTRLAGNVSWLHQEFPHNERALNFEGLNWNLSAQWQPVKHSLWSLNGWQQVEDPTENGGYILNSGAAISWLHHWGNDRLSTRLGWSYQSGNYHMSDSQRQDVIRTSEVVIGYDFRPSVRFELSYQQHKKTSNQPGDIFFIGPDRDEAVMRMPGYDQHQFRLSIKVQI
ncbi:hypothetical protein VA7868_00494 [Vibrio aerogenes CECT 7868]|uniref:Uncharacterized protein n=1 Tax=Vibrio aerogenes CECT 7868 TaxID=1216006 RepID=A0A1M5VT03_9VIBR|nr:outer membrane beta-barrel protein [Vibrio aerogenes]SHH78386.1 hypothetical protein VA7868_00494 [Vibrio aerogenes CECT 7868]